MPATTTTRKRAVRAASVTPTVIDSDDVEVLPAPVEFTVTFQHTFRARPRMTYKRIREVMKAQRGGGIESLTVFENMIRRALLDDDGVPAKWEPEYEGKGKERRLVGPGGDLLPIEDLPDLQALEAGSSRRRWQHLMDVDDELEVELEEIQAAYETLVEAVSDRPTQSSSR
jgi:hypothetical protein